MSTYIGIDLGGARGRTTALARLDRPSEGARAAVLEVSTRCGDRAWTDDVLVEYLRGLEGHVVVAVNAPLTAPACVRCTVSRCAGEAACEDPAVIWLRTEGRQIAEAAAQIYDTAAAVPAAGTTTARPRRSRGRTARITPYLHRGTEVSLHFGRGLIPRGATGKSTGPVAARAAHLRRRLASHGYVLNETLLEVSARATVCGLFDAHRARGYKRDADPWETRAGIIEALTDLDFAPRSRLAREEVLRNDHCFEALLSGYTAFLAHRDDWAPPDPALAEDGWIWAP